MDRRTLLETTITRLKGDHFVSRLCRRFAAKAPELFAIGSCKAFLAGGDTVAEGLWIAASRKKTGRML